MYKDILHKLLAGREAGEEKPLDWQTQFEAIFSNLPVGLAYLTPDMRYIRLNPFLEKKLGLASDAVQGRHCYDTVGMYKDDPERTGEERICDVCGVKTALETGMPFKFTRRVSGSFVVENMGVPIKDKDGRIIGAMEIILDITERVHMEERLHKYATELEATVEEKTFELRKSKMFLNNIIESTADAIFTLDKDGRISYLNSAAEGILGHPTNLLFGTKIVDIIHPAHSERVERTLRLADEKEEAFHNLKVDVVAHDGTEKHALMSLSPLLDDEGKNRFVGICKDVTKEKGLEQEREEFITMLTHDLKTPLTSIIGYSSLILDGETGELNDDMKSAVEGVRVNAQRMLGLVKNFLSAGRINVKKMEIAPKPMKLEPLILECLHNMDPQIRDKGLTMETRFCPSLPRVTVDKEHIERVITNLISNAVKFTPYGGKITINACHTDEGYVNLEFEDSGVGIPEEELPLLFDKYYQGKGSSRARGTGLGLYIVKNIVEAHQGSIHVNSLEGKGTTFTVRLPQIA